jgi:hypothetical protein
MLDELGPYFIRQTGRQSEWEDISSLELFNESVEGKSHP